MFKLYFGETYVPVLNQFPIVDKLIHETGIVPEKINYFVWQTYPEKSHGKFLVAERDLLLAVPAFQLVDPEDPSEGTEPADPVPGFCTLQISDFQGNAISFLDVSTYSITSWNMTLANPSVVDGTRLLAIEVVLERLWFDSTGSEGALIGGCGSTTNLARKFSSWSIMTSYLFDSSANIAALAPPKNFNRYINYHHITPSYLAASVASMNGLVAFPKHDNVYNAEIGVAAFEPSAVVANKDDLIFVEQGTTPYRISLNVKMLTVDYAKGDAAIQQGMDIQYTTFPSSPFYRSTVLRNDQVISIMYPWELYDPEDPEIGAVLPTQYYASSFSSNILKKLESNFKIILKGVYSGTLNHTLNKIEYAFSRSGMITTLSSKEFKIHTFPFIDGAGEETETESIFIAQLNTHMNIPIALGNVFHVLNPATILYANVPIYDPLNLVTNYCSGTKCYVYKTTDDEFVVISGPCPPTEPCNPEPPPSE